MTHREHVLKRYGLKEGTNVEGLSKITGEPIEILQEVYNRGIGAYKSQPSSVRMKGSFQKGVDAPMSQKLSKENWAMARVYSYLDHNPNHDQDLRKKEGGIGSMDKTHETQQPKTRMKYDELKKKHPIMAFSGCKSKEGRSPSAGEVLTYFRNLPESQQKNILASLGLTEAIALPMGVPAMDDV